MKDNFYSKHKENQEVDLGKVFRYLLMQSKLILLVVLAAFIISYINYFLTDKKYLIQSLLQFETFDQNIFDPSKTLQMASSGTSQGIFNLTTLYESRTNYLKLINDLKLNIDFQDLHDDESIDIAIISDNETFFESHELKFSFSESEYTLLDKNLNEIETALYGEEISFDNLRISISSSSLIENRPISINFKNPESIYNSLKAKINVGTNVNKNAFFRNEGLITISYVSDDINLGKNIINHANNIFLNQRIYTETEKSRKAIDFIDKNIQSIEKSVEANKIKLKQFREKNKSIDVTLEIESIIKKVQSLEESLRSVDIELTKAQEIYTATNPIYLNLLNKKTLIEKQINGVLSEIELMPKEQQEYIDLYNDLEVSQTLFEELESRRLGFSILEASTIGDIRVVDDAYMVSMVSPRLIYIFIYTLAAFIIGCIIAIVRGYNYLPLSNPAEIFDSNIHIPVVGVIPYIDNIQEATADPKLTTSIESFILNINAIRGDDPNKNLISITSPTPFNGKSTISLKLAQGLSKIGKKVLLVDNDLKRGKIHKTLGKENISEKRFNSIDESTINEYLYEDNLYFIPRVRGLNNTFQFLYSYHYKDKIEFFKDYFDYVIFDTAPILSVADTSILVEKCDVNILVARHGISKINELKQAIDNYSQINQSISGLVYNAYARPKSYYGYYGIYGNYSYKYYADKYLDDNYEYNT